MMDGRKQQGFSHYATSFLAGGIAGMTSKTTVAPLDRVKILLQVHNSHYKNYGVLSGLVAIIRNESFLSLYKGNGAQMVRIFPYAAIQFMSFEIYKRALTGMMIPKLDANNIPLPNQPVNHELKFVAGAMAGVTAVLTTYPLDLVRARLASVVTKKESLVKSTIAKSCSTSSSSSSILPQPTTILGTLVSVFKNEGGFHGLYRGITPTILGMIPYGGCNFYMFERLKHWCVQHAPNVTCYRSSNDKLVLNLQSKLMCGGLAGAIGQTVIYPLDVARRRMQLSMTSRETAIYSESFVQTLLLTYRTHGVIRGLYRGLSINYIRAVPMVAVSFSTYEVLKQFFGMETGV